MTDVNKMLAEARRFAWWKRRQMRNSQPGKGADRQWAWKKLGSGHFSQVFEHPDYPGLVLKLSCRGGSWDAPEYKAGRFKDEGKLTRHDAWQPFAKMCMLNPAPNLPAVYAYEQLTPSYGMAIMKRYHESWGLNDVTRLTWREWLMGGPGAPSWMWPACQMREMMNLDVDLHPGNVMFDGDIMIMTDPFSVVN